MAVVGLVDFLIPMKNTTIYAFHTININDDIYVFHIKCIFLKVFFKMISIVYQNIYKMLYRTIILKLK
jgi:hypothetical protein